jgi:MoxR-like ATPase
MNLQAKFGTLREVLTQRHIERYDEVEITLVALLCKYHAVMIGPPGTAKSMLSEDLTGTFHGASLFKYLFTKFTTPEEVWGPYDLKLLKEGRYERILKGKLASAELAYIDEFFKANSAIQNTLLTGMNERQFDNGIERIDIPLNTVIAASNEMPEGEELWALFDRFHIRKRVDYIHEPGNFVRMLKAADEMPTLDMTIEDLNQAQAEVSEVKVSDDIYDTLVDIRSDMQMEGLIASDRRYRQTVRAMQATAWLHERDVVTDDDFRILEHMLWSSPEDIKKVSRIVLSHTNPLDQEANEIIDLADEIAGALTSALMDAKSKGVDSNQTLTKNGIEWFTRCRALADRIKKLENKAVQLGRPMNRIEQAKDRVVRVAREVSKNTMGIDHMDLKFEGRS